VLIEIFASQINNFQIRSYFSKLSKEFLSELENQVDIEEYIRKIEKLSHHIVALEESEIVGALFYYSNIEVSFVTHISVLPKYERLGIGSQLFSELLEKTKNQIIELEVNTNNLKAIEFYQKLDLQIISMDNSRFKMRKRE
jgi:ribosomal protein S18 acetylase RimI-like enzyme